METVHFTTHDNVELAAHLYLPAPGARSERARGIIVCHGFGSCKENYAGFGERAASLLRSANSGSEAGVAALIMDLRGHGESGGQVDANIFNDVAAALHYLQGRPEVNPTRIAIRGASMGGWVAIHAAAHLAAISPVIAVCPTSEVIMSVLVDELARAQGGQPSLVVPDNPPRVDVNSISGLLYHLNVAEAAQRIYPRPLLLVHCEGDERVPPYVSQHIYDKAREPKALWLLPGGDHRFAQHDPETDERILVWIEMVASDD